MKIYLKLLFIILFVSCCSNKSQSRYLINSETMQPGINPGDYVIEDSSIKDFTYGDIVGYRYFAEGDYYKDIFRVVGLPGDSIAFENDICIINGNKNKNRLIKKVMLDDLIEEEFPNGIKINIYHYRKSSIILEKTTYIPENQYFIVGDTRSTPDDSRSFGSVHKDKILGKIVKVIKEE